MKYIIEIKPEYEDSFKGLMILGAKDSNIFIDVSAVDDLEELTSDYIDKHYGNLQQDAYDKGYKDGRNVTETQAHDDAYQRGLNDAWEAARKVGHCKLWDDYTKDTGKPSACAVAVLDHYTAYEAIEKLKAYEEKRKAEDEIKAGDEVYCKGDDTSDSGVVTWAGKKRACVMWQDGSAGEVEKDELIKTNRHFDIASILKEMQS